MHVSHNKAQSKDFIKLQSGEKAISQFQAAYSKPKHIKTKLTSYTNGTMGSLSDVSTTVRAPSLQHKRGGRLPSQSHNFAELGAGLIGDTPRSKRSIELRLKRPQQTEMVAGSNPNLNEYGKRRSSMGRQVSRQKMRVARPSSSRNVVNYGHMNHASFI